MNSLLLKLIAKRNPEFLDLVMLDLKIRSALGLSGEARRAYLRALGTLPLVGMSKSKIENLRDRWAGGELAPDEAPACEGCKPYDLGPGVFTIEGKGTIMTPAQRIRPHTPFEHCWCGAGRGGVHKS